MAVQPLLQRSLARRRAAAGGTGPVRLGGGRRAALLAGAYATGTYGGYFSASQGDPADRRLRPAAARASLQQLNAVKNVLTSAVNAVAALTYIVVATDRVDWAAAGLVAAGSVVGGYLGGRFGRRLPSPVLRTAIVVLGCVAIAVLVTR